MQKTNNNIQSLKDTLESALSWYVAISMAIYGFSKNLQFPVLDSSKVLQNYSGMELMWTFYSYSRGYIIFIGIIEVLGAILLLFKTTRIFGCAILSIILINIILQDYFYNVNRGALLAAIMYQLGIIAILYIQRKKIIEIFNTSLLLRNTNSEKSSKLILFLASIVLVLLLIIFEKIITGGKLF